MLHPRPLPCILPRRAAKASPVELTPSASLQMPERGVSGVPVKLWCVQRGASQNRGSSSVRDGLRRSTCCSASDVQRGARPRKAPAHAQIRVLTPANRQPGSLHAGPPLFYA